MLNIEELTNYLLEQTEYDLKLIYDFGLEEASRDEEYVSFVKGRIRGYCSAVFALLLKLRSAQDDVKISDAIHQLIQIRNRAEKKIEEYLLTKPVE